MARRLIPLFLLLVSIGIWADNSLKNTAIPDEILASIRNASDEKNLDKLVSILSAAIKTEGNPVLLDKYKSMLADTYLWAGDLKKAFEIYAEIVAKQNDDRNALYGLCTIYRQDDSVNEKVKKLIGSLEEGSFSRDYIQMLSLIKDGRYLDAKTLCNGLLQKDPGNLTLLMDALQIAVKTGDGSMSSNAVLVMRKAGLGANIVALRYMRDYSSDPDTKKWVEKKLREYDKEWDELNQMDSRRLSVDLLQIRLCGATTRLEVFPTFEAMLPPTDTMNHFYEIPGYRPNTQMNLIVEKDYLVNIVPRDTGIELTLYLMQGGGYFRLSCTSVVPGSTACVSLALAQSDMVLGFRIEGGMMSYGFLGVP